MSAVGSGIVRYEEGSSSPNKVKPVPVYQIDFTAIASGKHVAATKRRVRWRFGFANREALEAGQTGIACRGEEHDVTLVWSITSGKRLLLADGHEVHYSMVRSQTFEFSWTMKGNHVLKVVAHAAPPAQRTPGFRQYDFFVDGKSFFTMPKVYRLGMVPETNTTNYPSRTAGGTTATTNDPLPAAHRSPTYNNYNLTDRDRATLVTTPIVALETPHNAEEERAYLEEAIRNSLRESHPGASNHKAPAPPTVEDLLLDFGEDSIPVSAIPAVQHGSNEPNVMDQQRQLVAAAAPHNPFDSGYYQGQSTSSLQASATNTAGYYHPVQPEAVAAATLSTPTFTGHSPFGFDSGYYQGQSNASLVQPVQAPSTAASSSPFVSEADGYFSAPPTTSSTVAPTPVAAASSTGTTAFGFHSGYYEGQQQPNAASGAVQVAPPPSDNPFFMEPTGISSSLQTTVGNVTSGNALTSSGTSTEFNLTSTTQQQQQQQQGGGNKFISGRSAEEAYQNLLNTGFSISSTKSQQQEKNPFDFASEYSQNDASRWGNTQTTLGQMQAVKKNDSKREVMKTSVPAPGAMTVSSNQQGNWGGYVNGLQSNVPASGTMPLSASQQGNWGGYGNGVQSYGGYGGPQQMQHPQQQFSQFQQQQPTQQFGQQQQPTQQYSHQQQMQYPPYNSGQQQPPMQYNQFQQGY